MRAANFPTRPTLRGGSTSAHRPACAVADAQDDRPNCVFGEGGDGVIVVSGSCGGHLRLGFAIAFAWIATSAAAAPTTFTLRFSGKHVRNTNPTLKSDLSHEGRFTASAPLCPIGTAVDTKDVVLEPLSGMRTHTCDDGTGTFTAFMPDVRREHGGADCGRSSSGRDATRR
jgi:hypothetical protein